MIRVEDVARELNLQPPELLQRSLLAFIQHERRMAEWDMADLCERYAARSASELEQKIQARQVASHPAWEDMLEWQTLEQYLSRLSKLEQAG